MFRANGCRGNGNILQIEMNQKRINGRSQAAARQSPWFLRGPI